MDPSEDTLDLQPGDWIVWQGEEIQAAEDNPIFISPGMVGKLLSVHAAIPVEDPLAEIVALPPRAVVEFENGMRLLVDARMKFEKMQRQ